MAEMPEKTYGKYHLPAGTETEKYLAGRKNQMRALWVCSESHPCTKQHRIFRCTKRTENKGCPGCGKIRKEEFEQFIFSAMQEKFKDFQILHGREEKVNPKLTTYQVELAQVEAEIEKLLQSAL